MLKINGYVTISPEQWKFVIEGMRNPMNSWDRSDSYVTYVEDPETQMAAPSQFFLGENDKGLMTRLTNAGGVHAKYRRMIPVWVSITAPLYWWKEFETYRLQISNPTDIEFNSCSTMHKITEKEFTNDDFSTENLIDFYEGYMPNPGFDWKNPLDIRDVTVASLNYWRERYIEWNESVSDLTILDDNSKKNELIRREKEAWNQIIQLLPSSYNQTRMVMLNYENLNGIYWSRKDHKLNEWHVVCDWIKSLPYAMDILGIGEAREDYDHEV